MSIRLTDDEAWTAIGAAHTGILTTLRADGRPITLPTWFVVVDRTVCLRTPARSRKVARVQRDPRASFLVEHGEQWRSLFGVHVSGHVRTVTDEDEQALVHTALDEKYRDYRLATDAMPESARQTYSAFAVLRLVPEGRLLNWDNSRMRLPN
jgi:PPOX class probable F420-dependent enzyme